MLDCPVYQRATFGFDRDVGANEDGLGALSHNLRSHRLALLFIPTRNDHASAFFGEQPDDAFAHSRARTGDDCYFVFYAIHLYLCERCSGKSVPRAVASVTPGDDYSPRPRSLPLAVLI